MKYILFEIPEQVFLVYPSRLGGFKLGIVCPVLRLFCVMAIVVMLNFSHLESIF
jgi:hypothetical protein